MDQPQQGDEQANAGNVPVTPIQVVQGETSTVNEAETAQPIQVSVAPVEQAAQPVAAPVVEQTPVAPVAVHELAGVANELQGFSESESPVVDEGLPMQDTSNQEAAPEQHAGVDPMEQIQAEEQASQTQSEGFGSGETANEMVMSQPPVEAEPVGQPMKDNGEVHVEPTYASEEPQAEQPQNTEAVAMANQAEFEKTPSQNPGELINDVIAPSAVAVAEAEGTSGVNAITGTPESSTVDSAQATVITPLQMPKKKSKKGVLVAVVLLVVLLFVGAAVAVYLMQSKSSDSSQSNKDESTSGASEVVVTPAPGEVATAKALDDYKAACGGGTVTNAADYKGTSPHPVVLFEKGSDDKYAMSVVAFSDKTWAADAAKVTNGQVVVCIAEKASTEKKVKTCPFTDATTKVTTNVDYFTATYTVDVYGAKTGDKLNSYEVASTVADCPTVATYDKADPKIVAKYDLTAVETAIKPDVTKVL